MLIYSRGRRRREGRGKGREREERNKEKSGRGKREEGWWERKEEEKRMYLCNPTAFSTYVLWASVAATKYHSSNFLRHSAILISSLRT